MRCFQFFQTSLGDVEGLARYLENERRWGKINLQVDSKGRSALHLASSFGDEPLMNILLKVPGIDLNLRDSMGMTPLFKAAQVNSPRCIVRLLESGKRVVKFEKLFSNSYLKRK